MSTSEKIAIVTDSCADVPRDLAEQYSIFVLPMVIMTTQGEFSDGVDITATEIYEIQKKELPKTGCPTGAAVMDTFEEIKRQGYTKVMVILLSGGLSGTVNNVRLLSQNVKELEVVVYDSRQASIGIGVIALQAAKYVQEGYGFEQLKEAVEKLIAGTKVFFSIDTLEFLQKGGRIGKVTAMAGTLLQIKPILSFDETDGEIYTAAKVRGKHLVESKLVQLVQESCALEQDGCGHDSSRLEGCRYNLVIADGGAPEEREKLEQRMMEAFPNYEEIYHANIGAALSVYLGKGLLGAGIQFLE